MNHRTCSNVDLTSELLHLILRGKWVCVTNSQPSQIMAAFFNMKTTWYSLDFKNDSVKFSKNIWIWLKIHTFLLLFKLRTFIWEIHCWHFTLDTNSSIFGESYLFAHPSSLTFSLHRLHGLWWETFCNRSKNNIMLEKLCFPQYIIDNAVSLNGNVIFAD